MRWRGPTTAFGRVVGPRPINGLPSHVHLYGSGCGIDDKSDDRRALDKDVSR